MPAPIPIVVPGVGTVMLVDRLQMRVRNGRTFGLPTFLPEVMNQLPTPPATFDWSKQESLKYPILGNDRYGDCFYAAVAHQSQSFTGNAGTECQFDVNALTQRYLRIAGGDNGLDDGTILPEWKAGIVGPNGPRKVLDTATVNPSDDASVDLGMWVFCGAILTVSLPSAWANNASPGATWDATNSRSVGGHAITLTGKNARGGRDLRTWGISPPINITRAGMLGADPEIIIAFSIDMFTPQGIAPCGLSYDDCANIWKLMTGRSLPPSPFGPAPPPPQPGSPVAANCIRLTTAMKAGVNGQFVLGSDMPAGDYEMVLSGDGPPPAVQP